MHDQTISQLFESEPLINFSLYTSLQVGALNRVGAKLFSLSANWNSGEISNFDEYYDLFWLWVLGCYEVLRTMDQEKKCFSERAALGTANLKKRVAMLRMPFAKQELRGNRGPITTENSVYGIRSGLVFKIEGEEIDSNELISAVRLHLNGIKRADILEKIHH